MINQLQKPINFWGVKYGFQLLVIKNVVWSKFFLSITY